MLWMLFRRPWEPSAEKGPTIVDLLSPYWRLGAPYWSLRGSHGSLRDGFCFQLGTQGHQKRPRGWLWDPLKTAIFLSVFEVLGAWGLPVGSIWTHMDAIWTPMELIGGRMVLIVAIVGL